MSSFFLSCGMVALHFFLCFTGPDAIIVRMSFNIEKTGMVIYVIKRICGFFFFS